MAEIHQIGENGQPKEKEASENSTESPTATSPLLKSQQGKNNHSSHRNATDESVSFVEDKDDDLCEKPPPPDTKNMVYLILLLHGIGVLLPWNTFLTIGYDYFISYKLNPNTSDTSGNLPQTPLQNIFINSLTFCAQIPNLALNLLNLFVVLSGGLHRRIYVSLITIAAVCIITILFVFVNTADWQLGFFIFTMATIVVLNSANGIYQNSIWGLVADFPGRFTNAIVLGNNLCGIMMAVLYILILLFNTHVTINASIFFSLALLTVISCMVTFHFLPTFPFYKYYVSKAAKARQPEGTDILHEAQDVEGESEHLTRNTHPSLATYISVLKECWRALFNIWIIFFVTLSIFPAILLDIKLYPQGRKFDLFTYFGDVKVAEQLFRQFSIFLNFNLFATIGSSIANFVQWPSAKYLSVPAVFRLLFIPLFWACNYNPEVVNGRSVVLFKNEWFFVTLTTLMALSHGYWSSLSMMYAPQQVQQSKSQIVGMMSGFFLVFGIAVGIAFTFIEPHIVNLLGLLYHSF